MKRFGWIVFGFFAVSIGLYPFMYFIVDRNFGLLQSKSEALLADPLWNTGFYAHIVFGGLALLSGWTQFSKKLRAKRMNLHRTLGKFYVIVVMISSIAGIYIGGHPTGGPIAMTGFMLLGILWFYTTLSAYTSIRGRNTSRHEVMMIFSYALCFAAVTLRIWLPILQGITGDFITAYLIVAWLCWVPNFIVAFIITGKKRRLLSA